MVLTRALGTVATAVTLLGALASPAHTAPAAPAVAAAPAAGSGVIQVEDTTVAVSTKVDVTGKLSTKVKRTVVLQQRTAGAWTTAGTKKTAASGKFVVKVKMPAKAGKVRVRAVAPAVKIGSKSFATVTSKTIVLSVVAADDPSLPGGPGSVEEPFSVGQTFSVGPWGFAFGDTDTDHWPEVQASGSTDTDAPEAGWSYITVPVTFTNKTAKPGSPFEETYVEFFGNDGELYDDSSGDQWCGEIPGSYLEIEDVPSGASATGLVCAVVPTTAIAGGLWRATVDDEDYEDYEAYVKLP